MRRLMSLGALSLGLLFPIGAASPAGTDKLEEIVREDPSLQRVYRSRSFQPGEVILLLLRTSSDLQAVHGTAFGDRLSFSQVAEGDWQALIGIDLNVPPGEHSVELRIAGATERESTFEDILIIRSKQFATRRLQVSEKYVNPPPEILNRIRNEARQTSAILAAVEPRKLWDGPFTVPVSGKPTSSFGRRSILNGQPRSPHSGTDFRAASGTPIRAPNSGRIALISNRYFSGNTIILDHGQGLYSLFAHLSAVSVSPGEMVDRGDLLGQVGSTGRVTGPHLHWSVRLSENRVDPLALVQVLQTSSATKRDEPSLQD